tara:strand:+ start:3806 stop:4006 length:201 start_codon:yes stop_codon:yes gene_type:complete
LDNLIRAVVLTLGKGHNQHYFLQCLEGSRSNVNKIYHRILNDKRHRDPIILDYQEIEARDFSAWEM